MKRKYQRLTTIAGILLILSGAALFIGITFKNNIRFFITPSQVFEENLTQQKSLKIGGLVKPHSVTHSELDHFFTLTDGKTDLPVKYHGILPELFRENQTIVVEGSFNDSNGRLFTAQNVLAKHDENYRPPMPGSISESETAKP